MYGYVGGLDLIQNGRSGRARRGAVRCSAGGPPMATALEIAASVKNGDVSAKEVVEDFLNRLEGVESKVNAFISVDPARAMSAAIDVDNKRAKGEELGPLAGVPIAVKDNLCTLGMPTTAGSRILENFVPAYSATAVEKMTQAGAIIVGKTNMDEYGMGSSTENSAFSVTVNPWNDKCVSGGSSGGSAAAVADGSVPLAIGSDTGGSIRQPASYCGVTGLKCSYGRISRHGLLAYASSLDTVGPIARSALDAAVACQVMAGHDRMDGTSLPEKVPDLVGTLQSMSQSSLKGVRIGLIEEALGDAVSKEVANSVQEAVKVLKKMGAKVKKVSLPRLKEALAAYYILAPSEASANLARYDGVRYGERAEEAANMNQLYTMSRQAGFGDEVKRRIMVGTFALSTGYYDTFYLKAQKVRTVVASDFQAAFAAGVDVLVSPVAPRPAFAVGEKLADPISMYTEDLLTIPASLTGLPALSVPCGFSAEGLPIGLQIIGAFCREEDVLKVGHAYQMETDFHLKSPPIS